MSKLTDHQIISMIERLESTVRNAEPRTADKARKKLAEYRSRQQPKNVQLERSSST